MKIIKDKKNVILGGVGGQGTGDFSPNIKGS